MDLITEITIFVLAAFVGFEVISKVPTTLHTPLMSQTNAIHGIVMLGGLLVIGFADGTLDKVIGPSNLPSEMATHASQLFSKNVENLLGLLIADDGSLRLDFDDEIVAGACITHEGEIRNERAKEAAAA